MDNHATTNRDPSHELPEVEAGEAEIANYEDVVAWHLERFGERDELDVVWERAGHTPGG